MNEETFESTETPGNCSPPKTDAVIGGDKLYPLDWNTTDVKLAKGRFVHTLSRPSNELMLEREDELETEISIAKDGSYGLPDTTGQEAIDARYCEKIRVKADGYHDTIPQSHSAAAFQGLFGREIYVDELCNIFGDEIVVIEEIGRGDEPDFVVKHILRGADEDEINKYRRKTNNARLQPDKRGRQKLVQKSTLRSAEAFYRSLFKRMEGAKVNEQPFNDERRDEFINHVNPLIQKAVVKAYIEALTGNLLD